MYLGTEKKKPFTIAEIDVKRIFVSEQINIQISGKFKYVPGV